MSSDQLTATLEKHFGHRDFLAGQEEPISALMRGEDAVIVMPTGGGKSLCYQLPALLLEGITVVVSPLIALMKDQVDALIQKGISATCIHSGLEPAEIDLRLRRLAGGEYRLVYVAPERFKSERFIATLSEQSISLFAVDEAHCISQWGHDFRPDYLRLRRSLELLGRPTTAALTATATPEVREDIVAQLHLGQNGRPPPHVFVSGFARHNLTLGVTRVQGSKDKLHRIRDLLRTAGTGIIYCATRKKCESLVLDLETLGITAIQYHGGMADAEREKSQNAFIQAEKPIVVATNAFGMGIDRPDIRCVIHVDVPGSIEAYYQEAGRAGRDGEPAACELLFNYADVRTQEFFIDGSNPTPELIRAVFVAVRHACTAGPIEKPIHEIAGKLEGSTNSMATGTALYLLERAGVIARNYQPGRRTYTTRLLKPDIAFEDIEIDFERLKAKRERDMAKLKNMLSYVDTRGCRHFYILHYFGDEEAESRCSHCDRCLSERPRTVREPSDEESVNIQKVLSCVARMNGRYGRGRIVQTLVGSKSKEILDARLDQLSTYGLLKPYGSEYVWDLLDALIGASCVDVVQDPYPVLSLNALGRDVMLRKKILSLPLPHLPAKKTTVKSRAGAANLDDEEKLNPDDQRLFELLKNWRRKTATAQGGKPAYTIFPDTTLRELARRKPRTPHELSTIKGVGPAKLRQYGDSTLAVIAEFQQ